MKTYISSLKPIHFLLCIGFVFFQSCKQEKKESKAVLKSNNKIEAKIDSLLSKMTLQEKIGQTAQRGKSSRVKELPENLKEAVRKGQVGSFLNITNKEDVKELQRIALEESPNGIPLIFARDVICLLYTSPSPRDA